MKVEIDETELKLLKEIHYTVSGWNDARTDGNFGDAKEWERHITRSMEHYDNFVNGDTNE